MSGVGGSDVALSITGVAGPEEQDGRPVGTVFFGILRAGRETRVEARRFHGAPDEIVEATLVEALALLAGALEEASP